MLIPKLEYIFKYTCNGKYTQKDIDRFISKINVNAISGNFEWTGTSDKDGYGILGITSNKRTINYRAHRVSMEIHTNELIPGGMFVCHSCDIPSCVNPNHLFLGTHQDNVDDKVRKNRQAYTIGESNGMVKLTWIIVNKIRKLWTTGEYTQLQLAEMLNINDNTIHNIIRNKTWKDNNYIYNKLINHTYKLTWEIVNEIRKLWAINKYSQPELAEMFNISRGNIALIVANKRWRVKECA